jgi:nucleotide-binding universal stress UspA family protein
MTSVHTILHPTDFSRCAEAAFQAACSLARDHQAQLIVLHAVNPVRLAGTWISFELFHPSKQHRWEMLRRFQTRAPDVWIEPLMRKGAPADVILDVAQETPCDLIVMSAGSGATEGVPCLCNVAAEVSRRAPCAVFCVDLPGICGHNAAPVRLLPNASHA